MGTFSKEAVAEAALGDKVSAIGVPVSNVFQDQFMSQYNCRVFPWALNYDCGGADYPQLFDNWEWLEKAIVEREGEDVSNRVQARWRRLCGEAPLLPGEYAKMLACRPEMQVAGDWLCVHTHWSGCSWRSMGCVWLPFAVVGLPLYDDGGWCTHYASVCR